MATVPPDKPAAPAKPAPPQRGSSAKPPSAAKAASARPATARPAPRAAKPAPPAAAAAAPTASAPPPEAVDNAPAHTGRFLIFNAVPAWMVSMVIHALLLVILALCPLSVGGAEKLTEIVMAETQPEEEVVEEFEIEEPPPLEINEMEVDSQVMVTAAPIDTTINEVFEGVQLDQSLDAAPVSIELADFADRTAPKSDLLKGVGGLTGTGVSGRMAGKRDGLVRKYGGTEESEAAVAKALKWLAAHQNQDGSWCFDHRFGGSCHGQCSHPGTLNKDLNGATAMALLPFLGAGQTHMEGDYQNTVRMGLWYLMTHQKADGSLNSGGSMYSHGLASIALCEAYAMTQDRKIMLHAQGAINFITRAQDPVGGGWRYKPQEPGDTSVVGWQLMALKSAHMGYLAVAPNTIKLAVKFLDSVQQDSGSFYGYKDPGRGSATTAVGLLCRMYTGWKHDDPALERGVNWISDKGPSKTNMYYNYYATQVLRHYEGEMWDKWNTEMRDYLVEAQAQKGHETGSWYIAGDHHGERAGRLYHTCMATMILEVYYRHMPIYAKAASTEDFPL
jgi:hypothetical protein